MGVASLLPTVVTLAVDIPRPPAAVWAVLTDADRSPRWLGGFRMVSTWEVGGPLQLVGTLNGHTYAETGTVRVFDPPHTLTWDHWSPLWRVPDTPATRAVLQLHLSPTAEGTRVDLHHTLPDVEAIVPHARFFWRGALHQLRALAEADPSLAAPPPHEFETGEGASPAPPPHESETGEGASPAPSPTAASPRAPARRLRPRRKSG